MCNLMTQPGETRDYTASAHLSAVARHVGGGLFDYVVLNTRKMSRGLARLQGASRAEPVKNGLEAVHALGVEPTARLLLEDGVARPDAGHLVQLVLTLARDKSRPIQPGRCDMETALSEKRVLIIFDELEQGIRCLQEPYRSQNIAVGETPPIGFSAAPSARTTRNWAHSALCGFKPDCRESVIWSSS